MIGVAQGDNVVAIYQIYVHDAPRTLSPIVPSGPSDPIVPPDTVASHQMTGIDRLQTKYKGSGIRIAVIGRSSIFLAPVPLLFQLLNLGSFHTDSGIDYTHPALGGGFGPGFKISKGYDFVGDVRERRVFLVVKCSCKIPSRPIPVRTHQYLTATLSTTAMDMAPQSLGKSFSPLIGSKFDLLPPLSRIVGANYDSTYGFVGVAPEASLLA